MTFYAEGGFAALGFCRDCEVFDGWKEVLCNAIFVLGKRVFLAVVGAV